jgi:chemotaxis protein MotD
LALEPDNLGTVTIRMRLVDSGLELKVEAENSETAAKIENDKSSLSDKLRSMGYTVDSVVVSTVAAQTSHLNLSNDQAMGQGQQQTASDAGASGLSQNGSGGSNDQFPAQRRQEGGGTRQETGGGPAVSGNISDGLYV